MITTRPTRMTPAPTNARLRVRSGAGGFSSRPTLVDESLEHRGAGARVLVTPACVRHGRRPYRQTPSDRLLPDTCDLHRPTRPTPPKSGTVRCPRTPARLRGSRRAPGEGRWTWARCQAEGPYGLSPDGVSRSCIGRAARWRSSTTSWPSWWPTWPPRWTPPMVRAWPRTRSASTCRCSCSAAPTMTR